MVVGVLEGWVWWNGAGRTVVGLRRCDGREGWTTGWSLVVCWTRHCGSLERVGDCVLLVMCWFSGRKSRVDLRSILGRTVSCSGVSTAPVLMASRPMTSFWMTPSFKLSCSTSSFSTSSASKVPKEPSSRNTFRMNSFPWGTANLPNCWMDASSPVSHCSCPSERRFSIWSMRLLPAAAKACHTSVYCSCWKLGGPLSRRLRRRSSVKRINPGRVCSEV